MLGLGSSAVDWQRRGWFVYGEESSVGEDGAGVEAGTGNGALNPWLQERVPARNAVTITDFSWFDSDQIDAWWQWYSETHYIVISIMYVVFKLTTLSAIEYINNNNNFWLILKSIFF